MLIPRIEFFLHRLSIDVIINELAAPAKLIYLVVIVAGAEANRLLPGLVNE